MHTQKFIHKGVFFSCTCLVTITDRYLCTTYIEFVMRTKTKSRYVYYSSINIAVYLLLWWQLALEQSSYIIVGFSIDSHFHSHLCRSHSCVCAFYNAFYAGDDRL